MISKAEFLEQIKKEISKENEEVGTDTTYKRFGNLNFKFELFIVFLILLPIFREDPPLAVFLALLILGVCFFLGVFQTESPIFSFLRNADLCSNAMIDITKEEYQKKYNVPQEELDRIFKNSNRILSCETLFPKNEKGTELFRYLFNYNRKIEGLIFKMENILVPFKEDNAIFYQIEVAQQFDLLNRRGSNSFFKGWVIQVNLNSFYKDPIVFIKRRFFGGRRGLKKVELRRQDPYFDVLSNNANAAQILCFQGVPAKLLRLDSRFFKFDKIEAVFSDDKLFIAIHTEKDLFKGMKRRPSDIHEYEKFYDQIAQIETYCAQFRSL